MEKTGQFSGLFLLVLADVETGDCGIERIRSIRILRML